MCAGGLLCNREGRAKVGRRAGRAKCWPGFSKMNFPSGSLVYPRESRGVCESDGMTETAVGSQRSPEPQKSQNRKTGAPLHRAPRTLGRTLPQPLSYLCLCICMCVCVSTLRSPLERSSSGPRFNSLTTPNLSSSRVILHRLLGVAFVIWL